MSRSQTTQTCDRHSYSSMSIRKLRSSSMVCNLTKSWQTWVSESEGLQAGVPSVFWAPSLCLGEAAGEPKTTRRSRKAASVMTLYPHPEQATAASQDLLQAHPGGNRNRSPRARELSQNRSARTGGEGEVQGETSTVAALEYRVKTKQAVKTVSPGAQEKSAGSRFLTERTTQEPLPSSEEIDKMLNTQKFSNTVSSPTKSWKQGGKEQGAVEHDEHVGAYKSLETEAGQKDRTSDCIETEHNGSPEEGWVKRRPLPIYKNKDAEEATKINTLSKKYSTVGDLKSRWQNWSSEHTVNQKLNPFSEEFDHDYSMSLRLHKGQEGYGRPKEGTMTAERAKRAEQHIHREIGDMCYVIRRMKPPDADGKTRVTFKELFDTYVRISDKVVGILMRARKHGKVAFEGEMLWQGQDDAVIITLLV